MAFTLDQYNRLIEAISQGAKRVKYADKEVEYPSLDDMARLKSLMEVELGLKKSGLVKKFAQFGTGLNK